MKAIPLGIEGLYLIEPELFEDERGFFFESFNHAKFQALIGRKVKFVQDNHSKSFKGVLRGLHFQSPQPQGKLVRVVVGEIFDVAVDIRSSSPTFGKWIGQYLSADNLKQHWIPEGFAHGFLVTSEVAEVLYKTTDYYHPEYEQSISWNDSMIGIKWPIEVEPVLSLKDQNSVALSTI